MTSGSTTIIATPRSADELFRYSNLWKRTCSKHGAKIVCSTIVNRLDIVEKRRIEGSEGEKRNEEEEKRRRSVPFDCREVFFPSLYAFLRFRHFLAGLREEDLLLSMAITSEKKRGEERMGKNTMAKNTTPRSEELGGARSSGDTIAWDVVHGSASTPCSLVPKNRSLSRKAKRHSRYWVFVATLQHRNAIDYLPLAPVLSWSQRILSLAHRKAGLTTLSAYISTLGGGYFLTRQLDVARKLALTQVRCPALFALTRPRIHMAAHVCFPSTFVSQERVALNMGDYVQAAQCRLNLAYGLVSMGKYRSAYRAFVREYRVGKAMMDGGGSGGGQDNEVQSGKGGALICSMARAAIVYTRKTARLMEELIAKQSDEQATASHRLGKRSRIEMEATGQLRPEGSRGGVDVRKDPSGKGRIDDAQPDPQLVDNYYRQRPLLKRRLLPRSL